MGNYMSSKYGLGVYGSQRYGQSVYGSQQHPYITVPGKIMWLMQIDWDGDGDFGSEIEPQTFTKIKFRRGRRSRIKTDGSGQEQPEQESFWIELIDNAGRYDGWNDASPLSAYLGAGGQAMRLMIVSTTSKASAEAVFVGVLSSVTYNSQTKRATLMGEGLAQKLRVDEAERVFSPCQPNDLAEQVWDACFVRDATPTTPYPVNWWRGQAFGLPLSRCAELTLVRASWDYGFYWGEVAFTDDQPNFFFLDGGTAWDTLKELADGFAARLFFLRDGRLFVMDRQDNYGLGLITETKSALEKFGLERTNPFEALRNYVEVKVRPHSVSLFSSTWDVENDFQVVWKNNGPIAVEPLSTIEFDVDYLYNGSPIVGSFIDISSPDATYQYACWSSPDGTGTNLVASGNAFYTVLTQANEHGYTVNYGDNEQRVRVRLQNTHATLTAYFLRMQINVVGIAEGGQPGTATVSNAESIALNRKRVLSINSRWVQDTTMAERIAIAYMTALANRKYASSNTLAYVISGDALYSFLVNYDLGTFVAFGTKGSAISQANFGMWDAQLLAGLELDWMSADGQDALVKCTYERLPSGMVGAVSTAIGVAVSSVAWDHTVPNGVNRLLVVEVGVRALHSVSSITWGGQSLTKHASAQYAAGDYARAEIWRLVAPAVGTGTITVTFSGSEYSQCAGINFVNVDQTTPLGTFVSATGTGAGTPAVNVVAEDGDIVIDILQTRLNLGTLVVGASQSQMWWETSDRHWTAAGSSKLGASSVAMTWTLTDAGSWVLGAVAVKSVYG